MLQPQPSIVVIDGPDKGLTVALGEEETVIGRDRSCRVSLSDLQASRRHAALRLRDGIHIVCDLGSANGTRLNGTRMKKEEADGRPLTDGDLIQIGNTTMRFRLPPPAAMTIAEDMSKTQSIAMDATSAGESLREDAGGIAELKRAKSDLEVLYRVSRDISALLDTAQLLPQLMNLLLEENKKIDRCSIHLMDEKTGRLECKARRVRRESALPGDPWSQTLIDQVLKTRNALLTYDAQTDDRFRAGESIRISNVCSAICAPLQTQQGLIGILQVDTVTPENRLTRDDLRLLAAVGVLAGGAIENARLYEKIAADRAELHAAHQDLKSAQGRLVQSEKLAAIGRLSSGIVHDVKNPLTVILGYAGLIRSKLRKRTDVSPEQLGVADDLDNIEKGIEYCTDVINSLLKFARPAEPAPARTNINALLRDTVAFVHVETRKAGVKLELQLDDTLPHLMIDPSQIKQVMINIILNAIQAMDKPDKLIRIRSEKILRADKPYARLSFTDNGTGMTDEQRSRIFEPFYTTKQQNRGPGGTGLGLAVSFMIIESNGGSIEVESQPGRGTTFILNLPAPA